MQTNKEIVRCFFPCADVMLHPGGSGEDSIVIGNPRPDSIGSYDLLSDFFLPGTSPETLWQSAYEDLVHRARFLVNGDDQIDKPPTKIGDPGHSPTARELFKLAEERRIRIRELRKNI